METKKKGAVLYALSAAWWIADGLYKDDVFKWARPRLPGWVVNPPVADLTSMASTLGVPLALFFLGTYFYFRKPREENAEPGFVIVSGRAAISATRTWMSRVLPIHIISAGLIIVIIGVAWQYLLTQQVARPVVATHLDLGPAPAPQSKPEVTDAPKVEASRPPLSAYEIELKLRLIDQALKLLSDTMDITIANGPRLQTGAWNAFKDPKNNPNYREHLLSYMNVLRDMTLTE